MDAKHLTVLRSAVGHVMGRFYSAGSHGGRTLTPPVQLTGLPRRVSFSAA